MRMMLDDLRSGMACCKVTKASWCTPSGLSNRSLPRRLIFPRGESGSFGGVFHLLHQPATTAVHDLLAGNRRIPPNWWLPGQDAILIRLAQQSKGTVTLRSSESSDVC